MRGFSFFLFSFLLSAPVLAKKYKIGLEPFPPFIYEEKGGLTEEMLSLVDKKIAGVEFQFERAAYKRIKLELKKGNYDLIGHTPYKDEVEEFYKDAIELDWTYPVCNEFVFIKPELLKNFKPKSVGTLIGNKEFLSQFKGMEEVQFFESASLESLLRMLKRGRLDAVWFATPALNHYLSRIGGLEVKRKIFPNRPLQAGLAVKNDEEGRELKRKIENALKTFDWKESFDKVLGKELKCRK